MLKNVIYERNALDERQWVYRDIYFYRGSGKDRIVISKKIEKMYKRFNRFINKNRFYLALLLSTLDIEKKDRDLVICFNEKKCMSFPDIIDLYKYHFGGTIKL